MRPHNEAARERFWPQSVLWKSEPWKARNSEQNGESLALRPVTLLWIRSGLAPRELGLIGKISRTDRE